MCEEMVSWAADKIHLQQREAHSADFVCDANTICPHFDGAHAKQCRTVEKALNLHLPHHQRRRHLHRGGQGAVGPVRGAGLRELALLRLLVGRQPAR